MKTSWWFTFPFEKYARQIGSFPQEGVKIKKTMKPPPRKESLLDLAQLVQPPT